ncbi:transporter [Ideonella sp. BN130291]|uniref:transporter n=1 Tax=Ideonella sp. BN130291 TaxID=3112940 RepID=UPI002E2707F1|nr:transporter [Ideonella sp. BN130291]
MTPLFKTFSTASALVLFAGTAGAQGATPPSAAASAPAAAPAAASAPTPAPATVVAPAQPTSAEAAREALSKKEGDVDQAKLLKETLTATDKQYSLIRKGQIAATYDLSYSYIGQQTIDVSFSDSGEISNFALTNTRGHTFTNTVSADYGVMNNLTANVTVPFVSRYSQSESFSGLSNAFGDISLGARFQPFALSRDIPALTTTATLRLPTGRSPFKTIDGQGLGTGSGYTSLSLGLNASKIVDPVALFGSFNVTLGAPAKHLSQVRNGLTLTEVKPGPAFGFGVGFAYALSYNISTSMSFQEMVSGRSTLTLVDNGVGGTGNTTHRKTTTQTASTLNLGLGVRVSPQTTANFNVGIGLTSDTPDFSFGVNVPLHF